MIYRHLLIFFSSLIVFSFELPHFPKGTVRTVSPIIQTLSRGGPQIPLNVDQYSAKRSANSAARGGPEPSRCFLRRVTAIARVERGNLVIGAGRPGNGVFGKAARSADEELRVSNEKFVIYVALSLYELHGPKNPAT